MLLLTRAVAGSPMTLLPISGTCSSRGAFLKQCLRTRQRDQIVAVSQRRAGRQPPQDPGLGGSPLHPRCST